MGSYMMRCPRCEAPMLAYASGTGTDDGSCTKCGYDYYEATDNCYVNGQEATKEEVDAFYDAPRPQDSAEANAWSEEFHRMKERISVCSALLRTLDKQYAWYDEEIRHRNEFRDEIKRSGSGRTDELEEVMPFLAWLDWIDLSEVARTIAAIAVYDASASDPLMTYIATRKEADHEKHVSEWRQKREERKKREKERFDKYWEQQKETGPSFEEMIASLEQTPASGAGGSPS